MESYSFKPIFRHGILKCTICKITIAQCKCSDSAVHYTICDECVAKDLKVECPMCESSKRLSEMTKCKDCGEIVCIICLEKYNNIWRCVSCITKEMRKEGK